MDQRNFSKIKTGKFGSKEENRNDFLVTRFVHIELLFAGDSHHYASSEKFG